MTKRPSRGSDSGHALLMKLCAQAQAAPAQKWHLSLIRTKVPTTGASRGPVRNTHLLPPLPPLTGSYSFLKTHLSLEHFPNFPLISTHTPSGLVTPSPSSELHPVLSISTTGCWACLCVCLCGQVLSPAPKSSPGGLTLPRPCYLSCQDRHPLWVLLSPAFFVHPGCRLR